MNNNGLEIERKFLISKDRLPTNFESYNHEDIEQGYLLIIDGIKEERIRHKGNKYYHTIKTGKGVIRGEDEHEISKIEFDENREKTKGLRIQKTRYSIPYIGKLIELDVYKGKNEGLIVAEIEFSNKEECDNFIFPTWFGKEITIDDRYKNANLAG